MATPYRIQSETARNVFMINVCNVIILILTLGTERIKLALILYQSHAIYGTKG